MVYGANQSDAFRMVRSAFYFPQFRILPTPILCREKVTAVRGIDWLIDKWWTMDNIQRNLKMFIKNATW